MRRRRSSRREMVSREVLSNVWSIAAGLGRACSFDDARLFCYVLFAADFPGDLVFLFLEVWFTKTIGYVVSIPLNSGYEEQGSDAMSRVEAGYRGPEHRPSCRPRSAEKKGTSRSREGRAGSC